MSAYVLLNILKLVRKSDKMLAKHFITFSQHFIQ